MSTATQNTKISKVMAASRAADYGSKLNRPKLTKRAQLLKLLSTKKGAELAQLSKKLSWRPHTTRASISTLRKQGHAIELNRAANGKPSRYKITCSQGGGSTE